MLQVWRGELRVWRRDAHNLRGWKLVNWPGFMAQQLHVRLISTATPVLFGDPRDMDRAAMMGAGWGVNLTWRSA